MKFRCLTSQGQGAKVWMCEGTGMTPAQIRQSCLWTIADQDDSVLGCENLLTWVCSLDTSILAWSENEAAFVLACLIGVVSQCRYFQRSFC